MTTWLDSRHIMNREILHKSHLKKTIKGKSWQGLVKLTYSGLLVSLDFLFIWNVITYLNMLC